MYSLSRYDDAVTLAERVCLLDNYLASFTVLTYHIDTLTQACEGVTHLATVNAVNSYGRRCNRCYGLDTVSSARNGDFTAMNVNRVACTVLEENVDRIVALDGCWVSAVVQILNACPGFSASRHDVFEQRLNLN